MAYRSGLTISFLLVFLGLFPLKTNMIYERIEKQIHQKENLARNILILQEDAVVFLKISRKDRDILVSENPKLEGELSELLADYSYYGTKIKNKLKELGFRVEAGGWTEVWFKQEQELVDKVIFNMRDIYALVLYKKGYAPVYKTGFTVGFDTMAEIISEYFNINIK